MMNRIRKAACILAATMTVGLAAPLANAQTRKKPVPAARSIMTGAWLYKQIAAGAAGEAVKAERQQAGENASTWRSWSAIYGERATLVPTKMTAAGLAAKCIVHLSNVTAAARANGDEAISTLAAAELQMWRSLALQIARGGAVTVKLPAEFLIPVP